MSDSWMPGPAYPDFFIGAFRPLDLPLTFWCLEWMVCAKVSVSFLYLLFLPSMTVSMVGVT